MHCQYLSHKHSDHRALARLEADYVKSIQPKGSVCIRTCHRLEFYANEPFELPAPPESLGSPWTPVSGLRPVLTRLACLAAGVKSRILGEQFVAHQCSRPFLKSHDPHLPFGLIVDAFDVASRLKKSFRFDTRFSYDDAAFTLLDADRRRQRPTHLVVFGAGLLGQAIVEHARALEYQATHVITRNPSDFLHLMHNAGKSSIQASTIADAALPPAYDCIIATDNRNAAFAASVNQLLKTRSGGNAVDLCAVPVISDALSNLPGAYHMGSLLMQSLIDEANASLGHLVVPLTEGISKSVSDLCASLGR